VRTLAQIARVMTKAETRQALLEAATPEQICDLIRQAEAAM
jgi:mannitol/fructose-specific phosphotransferase system IIA component (Ntr-type)